MNEEKKLKIKIGYINDDIKIIYYDKLGNKSIEYENQTLTNEKNIDLRDYKDTKIINRPEKEYYDFTDKFIITPSILKEKELDNFKEININRFILMSDNEMEINPIKLELTNVILEIFSIDEKCNVLYLMEMNKTNEEYHIYIDNDNKLNIIDSNNLKNNSSIEKYKYLQNNN